MGLSIRRNLPTLLICAATWTVATQQLSLAQSGVRNAVATEEVAATDDTSNAGAATNPQQRPIALLAANEPPRATPAPATPIPSAVPDSTAPVSDAERITRLERMLEQDMKRLAELAALTGNAPDSEYAKAESAFRDLDEQREAVTREIQRAADAKDEARLAVIQAESEDLERKWTLAKQRFQLAIEERQAQQANYAALEQKIQKDRELLERLRGNVRTPAVATPPVDNATPIAPNPSAPVATPATTPIVPAPLPAAPPTAPVATDPNAPPTTPATPVNSTVALPISPMAALLPNGGNGSSATTPVTKKPSKELVEATEAATQTAAAAEAAEEAANSISERMQLLQQNIAAERKLRDLARKKVDNADDHLRALNEELQRKLSAGENVNELRQQVNEAVHRLTDSRAESRRLATHLDELQTELGTLQADQLEALRQAQERRSEADQAKLRVDELNNPFAPNNMLQWLLNHGVNVLVILLAVGGFVWLARVGEARLIKLMASRARAGNQEERENRAKTLVGVFRNAANILTVGGGAMMILDELGLPVGPLLGGAAVIGLAVAFGAQSLIKDYFTGFMVLSEQQYMINDVIKVGEISGQVERITLRMTVLRDLEGRVHFIPHGQINTVTNMTHGWSRAVFEVGVAYKEDVDRVREVILELGSELRSDPQFGRLILEDLTMLGLDSLGDSAVTLKFFIKTRPLQQWTVKREMLRRIKNRFDEVGIEIPFPHRTVYHRDFTPASHVDEHREGRWAAGDAA